VQCLHLRVKGSFPSSQPVDQAWPWTQGACPPQQWRLLLPAGEGGWLLVDLLEVRFPGVRFPTLITKSWFNSFLLILTAFPPSFLCQRWKSECVPFSLERLIIPCHISSSGRPATSVLSDSELGFYRLPGPIMALGTLPSAPRRKWFWMLSSRQAFCYHSRGRLVEISPCLTVPCCRFLQKPLLLWWLLFYTLSCPEPKKSSFHTLQLTLTSLCGLSSFT
jgi:hypothetical protein